MKNTARAKHHEAASPDNVDLPKKMTNCEDARKKQSEVRNGEMVVRPTRSNQSNIPQKAHMGGRTGQS